MASFADAAFAKDTAFASTAFDFGVAAPSGGPEGGVSGYLSGRKRKRRSDYILGDIQVGGNLLPSQLSERARLEGAEAEAAIAEAKQDEQDIEHLLLHITSLYYND